MQFLWWVVSEVKGSAQRSGDVFFVVSVASKPCLRAEAPIFLERMEVEGLPGPWLNVVYSHFKERK